MHEAGIGTRPALKIALRLCLESNPPSRLRYEPSRFRSASLAMRFKAFSPLRGNAGLILLKKSRRAYLAASTAPRAAVRRAKDIENTYLESSRVQQRHPKPNELNRLE